MVVELTLNLAYPCVIILLLFFSFTMDLESTPIYQYAAPTSARLQPLESSKPILTPSYELRQCLINIVRDQSFSGKDDENPYSHLNEFEQACACLRIVGMSDETLR